MWDCSRAFRQPQAMRRTMEIYSSTTRFALACNLSEKIIEPIQSRCAILRYSKLTDQQVRACVLALERGKERGKANRARAEDQEGAELVKQKKRSWGRLRQAEEQGGRG
eukprot:scaffold9466_cov73-Isochrysis_galbana.AAC.1